MPKNIGPIIGWIIGTGLMAALGGAIGGTQTAGAVIAGGILTAIFRRR